MTSERLANRLKVARAEINITQEALAELIGTTRKSINAIEMERMVPSALLALKLARWAPRWNICSHSPHARRQHAANPAPRKKNPGDAGVFPF